MEEVSTLHVVMFPWLALGHLIPFLELSKCLAKKGHHISLVSTPRNLQRLPPIPPNLTNYIDLVTLPFPQIHGLPEHAEASTDIPIQKTQLLKKAFDALETPLSTFLQNCNPDWIIYDYASHWLPALAARLGVPCGFFSLFNAAVLAYMGSPSELLSHEQARSAPEDFTLVPKWIPFHSNIVYKIHEILPYFKGAGGGVDDSEATDFIRFGTSIRDCQFVAIRSCNEFESEWIAFLADLYKKPVVLVGPLHPCNQEDEQEDQRDAKWFSIREWFDKQAQGSVVYVALGSEATLSKEQVKELALGLELSRMAFYWVLRPPPGSSEDVLDMLPEGFMERSRGRGIVTTSWSPQVSILGHDSVGAFLTHCGWNSVIEGLGFGRVLVMLPVMNEQGLNARLLEGKKVGVEIARDERDGTFRSESVAESLRMAMVDEEGKMYRTKAMEMKEMFGNKNRMGDYVDGFVAYLRKHRAQA